jgi:excinuclease UvrABC helicase subunit UvrB
MYEGKTALSPKELTQMASTLETQMLTAAEHREYARAETLQKRLTEIKNGRELKVNQ